MSGRGAVAVQHPPVLPALESHQVAFLAVLVGLPVVGEGVTEDVDRALGVETDAAEAALHGLELAVAAESAPLAQPEPGLLAVGMAAAGAQVTVQGQSGLLAEGDLADARLGVVLVHHSGSHHGSVVSYLQVIEGHDRDLGTAGSGVEQAANQSPGAAGHGVGSPRRADAAVPHVVCPAP